MADVSKNPSPQVVTLATVEIQKIEPIDIARLIRVVWHGKALIAACTVFAVLLAGYYVFAMTSPRFTATTTLEINFDPSPTTDNSLGQDGAVIDQTSLNTDILNLRSRHLLKAVIDSLNLTEDPEFNRYLTPISPNSIRGIRTRLRNALTGRTDRPPTTDEVLEKTIQNLAGVISAKAIRNTYVFRVSATTSSPQKSAVIANTLAQVYLADQVQAKRATSEASINWLSARVRELQQQLEIKETAVNDLIATGLVNDSDILNALSHQASEAGSRLNDTQAELAAAQDRLKLFDQQNATTLSTISHSSADRSAILTDVARLSDQADALSAFKLGIDDQIRTQSANLIQLQQLRREVDAARIIYETFLTRLKETTIQHDLQSADSRVLTLATTAQYVAPRKMLILLIAAVLGAFLGAALVFVRHAFRRGFHTSTDLRKGTGMPVFGQLPRTTKCAPQNLLNDLSSTAASPTADAMQAIRTSLLLADPAMPPQVILSTSSVPREGKTTLAIALAHDLARIGRKVLLVDADLRQNGFAPFVPLHGTVGLADVVQGKSSLAIAVARDPRIDADILAGPSPKMNGANILADPRFADFVTYARKTYDHIIIDAPPVLVVPDALLIAQQVDTVVLAVQWAKTSQTMLTEGMRTLESAGVNVGGLVLSHVDVRRAQQNGATDFAAYRRAYYQH